MDKNQLSLLVGSIVSCLLGVVIWVVVRPKLGTEGMVEAKPNTYAAKIYGRLSGAPNQIFVSKKYRKNLISYYGIIFFLTSIIMTIAFIISLFK